MTADELAGGRLTIDLAALRRNWTALAARAPNAECGAVVKGDGYGIGLEAAARSLSAAGCATFFVALPEEGLRARAEAPAATIYVLDGLFEGTCDLLADAALRPVLGSMPEIAEWAAFNRAHGTQHPCAIHVDTGMNRLGLVEEESRRLAADADLLSALAPALVISHLACADTPEHPLNARQVARFGALLELFAPLPGALANSAGVLGNPASHFDLLRPGVALYGGAALANRPNPMAPVVTLEARIMQVRDVAAGETVGYAAAEALKRASRIAVVGAGYADGYIRRAGSADERPGAVAWIDGHSAPLVGRVSMDMLAVDVTDVPEAVARRGAWVELFGPHVPIADVARHADTIDYELLTGLGARYRRVYVGAPEES